MCVSQVCLSHSVAESPWSCVCVSGVGVVVIIVVCVGFLLFMIVLGVIRIRSAHQRGQGGDVQMEERQEMEWDNSALTITVNPMDQEVRRTLHLTLCIITQNYM